MSAAHPMVDVCDMHSKADLWGLGPGCYPKAKAPKPTFHPFCRCRLRSRPSLQAAMARETPGGEVGYLRTLPLNDAIKIAGSRTRLQQLLNGGKFDDVVNAGKDSMYRLERLGNIVGMNATVNESVIRKSVGDDAWNIAVSELSSRVLPTEVASAGLTMAEQVALYTWTLDTSNGPWFSRINRVLRMADVSSAEVATVRPLIDGIQSALDKLPAYEGVVYRAIKQAGMTTDEWNAFLSQFVVGDSVALKGLSGSSADFSRMLRGRVRMTIISKTGRDISSLSNKPEQNEVLFQHNARIEIEKVEFTKEGAIRIWALQI